MNNSATFQLTYRFFKYFFRKFSLSVAMATKQIKRFGLNWYIVCMIESYARNISVRLLSTVCSATAINANFHFPHYNSMAILSCHTYVATRVRI